MRPSRALVSNCWWSSCSSATTS